MKIGPFIGYLDLAMFEQKFENFIEFTFGSWGPEESFMDPAQLYGFGFKSLNTGESTVRGWEASLMGQAKFGADEQHTIDVIAGYTNTNPVCSTPDFNYNTSSGNLQTELSYLTTSYDTTNYILKYRSQHLVRFDAQWTHPKGFVGLSTRYQSAIQNFDKAFVDIEDYDPNINWGLGSWVENNPKQPWIVDLRVGWELRDSHKLSVVASNLFNKEYAIRPQQLSLHAS